MTKYVVPYNLGDLVRVIDERRSNILSIDNSQKFVYHKRPIYVFSSLEMFISSSFPGSETVYHGDMGIVVETPYVWNKGPGLIFGVLFEDKKKYIPLKQLELIQKAKNI